MNSKRLESDLAIDFLSFYDSKQVTFCYFLDNEEERIQNFYLNDLEDNDSISFEIEHFNFEYSII